MNLNKVLLIGRLAADPEIRNTASGQLVGTVRIATSRVWNDQSGQRQEQTEFHSVVCWGKLAELAQKYMQKGQLVHFEGRLQNRSWQAQDGTKRYATEVVAENLQLGPRAAGASYSPAGGSPASAPSSNWKPPQKRPPSTKTANDEDQIPVIHEDEPVSNPTVSDSSIESQEIDLKDIPF